MWTEVVTFFTNVFSRVQLCRKKWDHSIEESGKDDSLSDSNCEKQWRDTEIAECTLRGWEVLLGPLVTVVTGPCTPNETVPIDSAIEK